MATAEQLLHEAQYAFASISFGESLSNKRNRSRATSLCRKIMRKYPGTMESQEAYAILQRLGEEGYTSGLRLVHQHRSRKDHRRAPPVSTVMRGTELGRGAQSGDTLDWGGLVGLILGLPGAVLFAVLAAGFIAFAIFGWLLVLPLIALILFTGPFRSLLRPDARRQLNDLVARLNTLIDERRNSGGGFS